MPKLNLKAVCNEEESILKYLEANASEALTEKINKKAERPMIPCLVYCHNEAKKLYDERKGTNNCIMIDDATVFGWAVHYYEDVEAEEDIKKANALLEKLEAEEKGETKVDTKKHYPQPPVMPKKEEKPKKPTAEKLIKAYQQLSLLDMLEEE